MISNSEWLITVIALSAVILLDLTLAILRRHKETTIKEAATWTLIYVGLAIIFGTLLPHWASAQARFSFRVHRCRRPPRLRRVLFESP